MGAVYSILLNHKRGIIPICVQVGQLCRFGSKLIARAPNPSKANGSGKDPVSVERIIALFLQYMGPTMDMATKSSALQACGYASISIMVDDINYE